MDSKKIKEELISKFGNLILDLEISEKEQMIIARIDVTDLVSVEKWTDKIYDFLDQKYNIGENYAFSLESKGEEIEVKINDLNSFLNKKLRFALKKDFKGHSIYVGELLENNEDDILIKWNDHGQFKKIKLQKENIEKIEIYIKY